MRQRCILCQTLIRNRHAYLKSIGMAHLCTNAKESFRRNAQSVAVQELKGGGRESFTRRTHTFSGSLLRDTGDVSLE